MGIISQEKARNYLPLDVQTRLSCCQRRANSGWSVKKICSYCRVCRQSLWRRMARFDGSEFSDKAFKRRGEPMRPQVPQRLGAAIGRTWADPDS